MHDHARASELHVAHIHDKGLNNINSRYMYARAVAYLTLY